MKRKFLLTMFAVSVALSGCGNTSTATSETIETVESIETSEITQDETVESAPTEETSVDINSIGDIQVEEELFDVTMNIPANFIGDQTQEQLDAISEEKGYKSIVLNEDGSATYTMSKKKHKELMDDITLNINNSLDEMVCSEEYPNITAITTNDNFTEFTIYTTSAELSLDESFSVLSFYMYGGMYNVFNGTSVDNVHVEFVNSDSGEVISSSDSSDNGD